MQALVSSIAFQCLKNVHTSVTYFDPTGIGWKRVPGVQQEAYKCLLHAASQGEE